MRERPRKRDGRGHRRDVAHVLDEYLCVDALAHDNVQWRRRLPRGDLVLVERRAVRMDVTVPRELEMRPVERGRRLLVVHENVCRCLCQARRRRMPVRKRRGAREKYVGAIGSLSEQKRERVALARIRMALDASEDTDELADEDA
jgi:hypothetical protein